MKKCTKDHTQNYILKIGDPNLSLLIYKQNQKDFFPYYWLNIPFNITFPYLFIDQVIWFVAFNLLVVFNAVYYLELLRPIR